MTVTKTMPTRIPRWLNVNVILTVLIAKALVLIFAAAGFSHRRRKAFQRERVIFRYMGSLGRCAVSKDRTRGLRFDRRRPVFDRVPSIVPRVGCFAAVYSPRLSIERIYCFRIASLAAALALRSLVKLDHSERTSQLAVVFLFIFPTSYFLHIPYTESLFLALVIGSFVAARKRAWVWAGVLGGLACLTRINGLILFPALAFETWIEYRESGQLNKKWLFLILIPLGFSGYLALNYFVAGDALMFMTYQREHWYRYFRWPWEGIWETYKRV